MFLSKRPLYLLDLVCSRENRDESGCVKVILFITGNFACDLIVKCVVQKNANCTEWITQRRMRKLYCLSHVFVLQKPPG